MQQQNGSTAGRTTQHATPQSNGLIKPRSQQQQQTPPLAQPSPAAPVPGAAQAKLLARAREAAGFTSVPAEQPAPAAGQSPTAQPEKKKPKREKRKKPEADAADTPPEAAVHKKAKEEKRVKAAAQARLEPRASGPGNAEQAATIRQTLGITPSPAATQAANHFQFQFSRPPAAPEVEEDAAVQSSSSEESDDAADPAGDVDDGEDDSRAAVDTTAAPRAQAIATPPTVQSSVARELQERAERIRSGDTGQRYIPRR